MTDLSVNMGLLKALLETALLVFIGYLLRKLNFFKKETVDDLTKFILYLCLPALIFYSFLTHLRVDTLGDCSFFLLLSFVIFAFGFLIGITVVKFFLKNKELKREFVLLNAFQNSGYLPLALVANMFVSADKELAYLYIFSYLIGFNLIMLSFGFYYMKKDSSFKIRDFLSAPFLVSIAGVLAALLGLGGKMPAIVMQPIHRLGETTIPLSMILLGMILAQSKLFRLCYVKELLFLVFSKLIFLPLIVLLLLKMVKLPVFISFLVLLEASMPSATTLSLIAHYKNANTEFVSQGIIYTHLFLIITLPFLFWLL
ncbi:MAG: AEC family transporter [Candidatus Saelkia tenebricola]|nr:AEC family transporter [Candidatus Saelkia tenebricola]